MQFEARWWWIVARFRLLRISVCIDPIRLTRHKYAPRWTKLISVPNLNPLTGLLEAKSIFFISILIILYVGIYKESWYSFELLTSKQFSIFRAAPWLRRLYINISTRSFNVDMRSRRSNIQEMRINRFRTDSLDCCQYRSAENGRTNSSSLLFGLMNGAMPMKCCAL